MAALMAPAAALSQSPAPVNLGAAANFAVLAGSTVSSTGLTTVTGDLGVSPGTAVTGFPPGTVSGTIHAGNTVAANAQNDLTIAYNDAAGRSVAPVLISGNLGGLTLIPGLYNSTSSLAISSGDLTLDAQGDANAVFIFQIASTLTTTSGRQVILSGGAQASNIFWQVGSSATLGTNSVFKGNILALASITLTTGATLEGRALARTAAVTLDDNTVTAAVPASSTPITLGSVANFAVLAGSTVTNTGLTTVTGDLGVSPGTAVTGFPPGTLNGTIHAGNTVAANAQSDLTIAYNNAAGRTGGASVSGNLGGLTLIPGLYKSTSSLEISSGNLTLDAQGNPNAVFIFQIASTLTTTSGRKIILSGGAKFSNIFWQVGSSATLGMNSVFKGNILALQSITLATGATLDGRALAQTGAVTLDANTIAVSRSPAPVPLGSVANFAVLAASTVTNTGFTTITGDIGLSPGTAVTGFPPGTVNGTIHAGNTVAANAQNDLTIAFNDVAGRSGDSILISGNLGGLTLVPGLYKSTSSLAISSGDLTLDAQGNSNAVFIFQIASTLTTTPGRRIILSGGAKPSNIFWQVGSSATLGTNSIFKGNILALASITLTTGATLDGRALARMGTVTLDGNTVTAGVSGPPTTLTPVPLGSVANFAVLAGSTVTNTGPTTVTGDLGVSPGTAVTGFPPGTVTGTIHAGNTVAANAQNDLTIAYNDAAGRTGGASVSGNLGGLTLTPGIYKSTSSLEISSGDLTLDAQGNSNAVFIFQIASTLTTTSGRKIILSGNAQASNIFWQVGSSATLATNSVFKGNILALASITLTTDAALDGRALARMGAVTLGANIVIRPERGVTDVENGLAPPEVFTLSQNYPNPFNPSTNIQYSLGKAGKVSLKIFNLHGHEVATLVNGHQEAGSYTVPFNTNEGIPTLPSGVYFYRLEAGYFVASKKLVLMK